MLNIQATCELIRSNYSPCDVADALLTLQVPGAGYLKDISPLLSSRLGSENRIVAPISTVLFVDKNHDEHSTYPAMDVPPASNVPQDRHFTDVAPTGSVVLMQQPPHHSTALLGDIIATRYKLRGVRGVLINGRARDVVSCAQICDDRSFQIWSKGVTCAAISLEGKLYGVDVPLRIGGLVVSPGDVLVADEGEGVACVIPRRLLEDVVNLLAVQKEADDKLMSLVREGMGMKEAKASVPEHYANK
jgi:regulator of RNase E activity RraA